MSNTFINYHKKKLNIFFIVFLFFLPYSGALVLDIGFPLKVSEIALFFLIAFYKIHFRTRFSLILLLLVVVILFSMSINFMWDYSYSLNLKNVRFNSIIDPILKFIYVILAFLSFFISIKYFNENRYQYLKYLFYGTISSCLYGWYLFISGIFRLPIFLLFGMGKVEGTTRMINLPWGSFLRSGTFVEGNYMGLYLLVVAGIAISENRKKMAIFLLISIIPTFSSIALLFALLYFFMFFVNPKYKILITNVSWVLLLVGYLSIGVVKETMDTIIIDKVLSSENDLGSNASAGSKFDRILQARTAFKMGIDNPLLGVGISNYSLHYDNYNRDISLFLFKDINFKHIPNNIYLEFFSEMGVLSLLLFLYFLRLIYQTSQYGVYKVIFWSMLVYFFAFPSFSVLFLWVFLAYLGGTNKLNKI